MPLVTDVFRLTHPGFSVANLCSDKETYKSSEYFHLLLREVPEDIKRLLATTVLNSGRYTHIHVCSISQVLTPKHILSIWLFKMFIFSDLCIHKYVRHIMLLIESTLLNTTSRRRGNRNIPWRVLVYTQLLHIKHENQFSTGGCSYNHCPLSWRSRSNL